MLPFVVNKDVYFLLFVFNDMPRYGTRQLIKTKRHTE